MFDPELEDFPETTRNKLIIIVGGIIGVVVLLAACYTYFIFRSLDDPSPTASPTVERTDKEEFFLRTMRTRPAFNDESDQILLDTGNAICTAYRTGASTEAILSTVVDSGVPKFEAGYLIGGSVKILCPEFTSKLPA